MKKMIFLISTLFSISYALADIPENSICKTNASGKLECVKINPASLTINGNNSQNTTGVNNDSNSDKPIDKVIKSTDKNDVKTPIPPINTPLGQEKDVKSESHSSDSGSNSDSNNTSTVIYKYVDAQGKVHYTDNLPKDKKIKATIFQPN